MIRGFKAKAEKISLSIRAELNLEPYDRLECIKLANHIGIKVHSLKDMMKQGLPSEIVKTLQSSAGKEFSAVLLKRGNKKRLIYNCSHSIPRIRNTIAHEIAHVLCGHDFLECGTGSKFLIRDHEKNVEDEADWLAGCLLVPGKGMERAVRNGMEVPDIAEHFDVSRPLAQWRYNSTGMGRRLNYLRKRS